MSYDLAFSFRTRESSVDSDVVREYFDQRQNYQCSESQAWYSNEITGVYFSFELPSEPSEPTDPNPACASFNINYFRPHVFGLEAERELTAFARHFDLRVSDPQVDGMGDGEYSPEGFLRGYSSGNRFAVRSLVSTGSADPKHTLPASALEYVWRWNVTRDERDDEYGGELFVPRISFYEIAGELVSGVVWTDGIPVLLPEVDVAIVPRLQMSEAPGRDIVLLRMDELAPILAQYWRTHEGPSAWKLAYSETPDDLEALIRSKAQMTESVGGVAMDQVLDRELVDAARASTA